MRDDCHVIFYFLAWSWISCSSEVKWRGHKLIVNQSTIIDCHKKRQTATQSSELIYFYFDLS
jgi:hypothetical protein